MRDSADKPQQEEMSPQLKQAISLLLGKQFGSSAPGVTEAFSDLGGIPSSGMLDALDIFSSGPTAANAATQGLEAAPAAGAGSYLPGLAGAYGAYNLLSKDKVSPGRGALQGAASGAGIGYSLGGPVGAGIGAGIGGVGGLIKGLSGSGKGEDQVYRDSLRKILRDRNVIDQNWSIGLADGRRYDIGKDADTKVNGLHPFDVDFSQATAGQDVGYLQPLAAILSQGNQKGSSDFTGYFVNAARSGGDPIKNMVSLYNQHGLNATSALERINNLEAMGLIDKSKADAYRGGIGQLKAAWGSIGKTETPQPVSAGLPRSTTRSPGILKNGQRIQYGR